ncbi:MAG: hypothetical protein HKN29_01920 [Rhodothermales bacterium]|nr:hypothetical protein [Rhodothermales bacterium]
MHETRRRHSAILLLGLILVGWLAAPAIHGIEHAMELAEATHEHDGAPQEGFAEACETTVVALEDCPICLTRVALETGPPAATTESAPESGVVRAHFSAPDSQPSRYQANRGPPVRA